MLSSVSTPHDIQLIVLALIVAAGGAFTTFATYAQLLARGPGRRRGWLLLTGCCAGATQWATNLVAVMADRAGIETSYDPLLALVSFLVAVAVAISGIALSLRPKALMVAAGGALIGLGVVAQHFIGIEAVTMEASFRWNWALTGVALAASVLLNAGALIAYRRLTGSAALLSGASLLTLGISVPQFIALAALAIIPNAAVAPDPSELDETILAFAIAVVAALILLAGYAAALLDARALRESAARIGELVQVAHEGLVVASDGVIVNLNARVLELCGRQAEELIGKPVFGALLGGPAQDSGPQPRHFFDIPLLQASGEPIPVEVVLRRVEGLSQGNEVYSIQDLRERKEVAQQLAEANRRLRQQEEDLRARNRILDSALATMSQGLCMYDKNQRVVICNERFTAMYGLPPDAVQPGMHLREVVQQRIDNGIYAGASPEAYMQESMKPVLRARDTIYELSNGQIVAVSRQPMAEGGWVTTHKDITEQRRTAQQVTDLTQNDTLTGLPRRTSLRDRLEDVAGFAARRNRRVAVLMIEIDRFSEINDTLGHAAGDALLKAVANRLQGSIRQSAELGRFGDDTFAVIEIVQHPGRDAAALAARILEDLRKPFAIGEASLDITATIGIAASPTGGRTADALLRNASLALNRGKIEGRGRHHFFEPAMYQELHARRSLEQELAEAVANEQFELHFQPIVSLASNEVTGFEALLRWRHPTRGLLAPARFLQLAEEAGHIGAIGEWTLQKACAEAMRWPEDLIVSVNLAVPQFRSPDFIASVVRTLAATGLPANRLEIDITEKVIHENPQESLKILRQLADLGVLIALDDFGAGFFSLTYIREFPFRKIKIDRRFVSGLAEREDARTVLRALAKLGLGLGMNTTLEGIETKEQLDVARSLGCTEMQGYYFSAPKTAEEIQELFLRHAKPAA